MSLTLERAKPYLVGLAVTTLIFATTRFAPENIQGTVVGAAFLLATWVFVWRKSDAEVEEYGLSLGGLIFPGAIDWRRLARDAGQALLWAFGAMLVTFIPYFFIWKLLAHPEAPFVYPFDLKGTANEVLGQLLLVALPEEAFYRGYLQTEFERHSRKVSILGARIGAGVLIASLIFALGHLSPHHGPERLLVFFPALLFGFLRVRTRGIGAGLIYHASCNLFAALLFRGFHVTSLSLPQLH